MPTSRYIRRYEPDFPLLGKGAEYVLKLESILADPKNNRGKVINLCGPGGTGKSEILDLLKFYVSGSKPTATLPAQPALAIAPDKALLFGGIIDLYNPTAFSGRSLRYQLVTNWINFYQDRHFRDYLQSEYKDPKTFFDGFLKAYSKSNRIRFAAPRFENVDAIVQQHHELVDEAYEQGLLDLCEEYTPLICLDTSELLLQKNYKGELSAEPGDVLYWLKEFLLSPHRHNCITILAGRPVLDAQRGLENALHNYLIEECQLNSANSEYQLMELGRLDAQNVKFYLYAYFQSEEWSDQHPDYDKQTAKWPLTAPIALPSSVQPVEQAWQVAVQIKKEQILTATDNSLAVQNLPQTGNDPALNNDNRLAQVFARLPERFLFRSHDGQLADKSLDDLVTYIESITEGKPLMVDWLCQLLFDVPDLLADINSNNQFKDLVAGKLFSNNFGLLRRSGLSGQQASEIMLLALVARRGLDAGTAEWLSKAYHQSDTLQALSSADAARIMEKLKKERFFKVRLDATAEEMRLYLHDEIFNTLYDHVNEVIKKTVVRLSADLAELFSQRDYHRSILKVEGQMDEVRKQPHADQVSQDWFDVADDQIEKYLRLERRIQDYLLERLFYRLKGNFKDGYDEYCRIGFMALAEYELGFYVRLRRETLQSEAEYREEIKSGQKEAFDPYFLAVRSLEADIRIIKRRLQNELLQPAAYQWDSKLSRARNEEAQRQARVTAIAQAQNQQLRELEALVIKDKETHQYTMLADILRKYNVAFIPEINGELDETRLGNDQTSEDMREQKCQERQSYLRRIELALADGLMSLYDYDYTEIAPEIINNPALREQDYAYVIRLATKNPAQAPSKQPRGKVRNYQFWQKHVLLGRAYNAVGVLRRFNYDLDGAIYYYKLAIENLKKAFNRVEIFLNDTRKNIAYAYSLRGQRSLAVEACNLALQNQLLLGHRAYIAVSENVLAEIMAVTPSTLEEAFLVSRRALSRFNDFEPAERNEIFMHHVISLTAGRILRMDAREHANSRLQGLALAQTLLKEAETQLREVYNYFQSKSLQRKVEALNELGCTYRTMGRVLDVVGMPDAAKSRQQEYWDKAEKALTDALTECQNHRPNLWYERIDNLLDLAQLYTYRKMPGQAARDNKLIEDKFKEVEAALEELQREIESSTSSEAVRGKQLAYWLLNGKACMRRAYWSWNRRAEEPAKMSKIGKSTDIDFYFEDYVRQIIKALGWFLRYQPDLVNDAGDYFRDLGYISRIEGNLNRDVGQPTERRQAVTVATHLLKADADKKLYQKKVIPKDNFSPDLRRGLELFSYMIDISFELGLMEEPGSRRNGKNP